MRDLLEKYVALDKMFPNKAGKLHQVLEAQKRLAVKIGYEKNLSENGKNLCILVAEGYDVAMDLLSYMKETIQDVANDAEALQEGSVVRNQHKMQSEEIIRLWDSLNK